MHLNNANWRTELFSIGDTHAVEHQTIDSPKAPYLKLHGSLDWVYNGERVLVSGKDKDEQIDRFPLLIELRETLRKEIAKGQIDLIVIGFSFGDSHILSLIEEGCGDDLRTFIVNPAHPSELINGIESTFPNLAASIALYVPLSLNELFPVVTDWSIELRRKQIWEFLSSAPV